jgi:hypothetical protein
MQQYVLMFVHIIDLVTRQFGLRIVINFDQVVKNNLKAEAFKCYFHYILLYGSSSPRGPKFSGPNVYGSSFVLCKFSKNLIKIYYNPQAELSSYQINNMGGNSNRKIHEKLYSLHVYIAEKLILG